MMSTSNCAMLSCLDCKGKERMLMVPKKTDLQSRKAKPDSHKTVTTETTRRSGTRGNDENSRLSQLT